MFPRDLHLLTSTLPHGWNFSFNITFVECSQKFQEPI